MPILLIVLSISSCNLSCFLQSNIYGLDFLLCINSYLCKDWLLFLNQRNFQLDSCIRMNHSCLHIMKTRFYHNHLNRHYIHLHLQSVPKINNHVTFTSFSFFFFGKAVWSFLFIWTNSYVGKDSSPLLKQSHTDVSKFIPFKSPWSPFPHLKQFSPMQGLLIVPEPEKFPAWQLHSYEPFLFVHIENPVLSQSSKASAHSSTSSSRCIHYHIR